MNKHMTWHDRAKDLTFGSAVRMGRTPGEPAAAAVLRARPVANKVGSQDKAVGVPARSLMVGSQRFRCATRLCAPRTLSA